MPLRPLRELKKLKGTSVIVRGSLNVPIVAGRVKNNFRLERMLPTLEYLKKKKAKTILIGHHSTEDQSLKAVAGELNKHLTVHFAKDLKQLALITEAMEDGELVMLENLRFWAGEKKNSKKLARDLAKFAGYYVNDAFDASHREHASIVALPSLLPGVMGLNFEAEVKQLSRVFKPKKPFVVILGGAKFATKVPLVKKILPKADQIFISGALSNTFFREMGFETGRSLVDKDAIDLAPFMKSSKVILPTDVVVRNSSGRAKRLPQDVRKSENILDIGAESLQDIIAAVKTSKMVLWNGPLGHFESGFAKTTEKLAEVIAKTKTISLVGGGDTIAAISKLKVGKKFSFVSTGGGAMLDFLADGSLVGIDALKRSSKP